jgi:hypothetical protein
MINHSLLNVLYNTFHDSIILNVFQKRNKLLIITTQSILHL